MSNQSFIAKFFSLNKIGKSKPTHMSAFFSPGLIVERVWHQEEKYTILMEDWKM